MRKFVMLLVMCLLLSGCISDNEKAEFGKAMGEALGVDKALAGMLVGTVEVKKHANGQIESVWVQTIKAEKVEKVEIFLNDMGRELAAFNGRRVVLDGMCKMRADKENEFMVFRIMLWGVSSVEEGKGFFGRVKVMKSSDGQIEGIVLQNEKNETCIIVLDKMGLDLALFDKLEVKVIGKIEQLKVGELKCTVNKIVYGGCPGVTNADVPSTRSLGVAGYLSRCAAKEEGKEAKDDSQ